MTIYERQLTTFFGNDWMKRDEESFEDHIKRVIYSTTNQEQFSLILLWAREECRYFSQNERYRVGIAIYDHGRLLNESRKNKNYPIRLFQTRRRDPSQDLPDF